MNLYEITQEQINLNNLLEESCGELTPELEEALALNKENFSIKVDGYIRAIKNYKAEVDAIAEEIKKLQDKKKVCENAVLRMKNSMKNAMESFDMKRYNSGIFTVSISTTKAVNVIDENLIDEKYKKISYTVSKTDIRDAIEAGVNVQGATLVENKNIIIK